ncbi:PhoPQ-activated pathogenicity-related family protein [Halomonas sp. 328]|uniref:PhoPQ-activated pathogenicity-related family protein n=1 Tax=Halomonas sp. 328 TaxID=2776704 RepID=UPI0018A7DF91|nr:PhoPQ-activated protein PqaA family protein [Halomonas sp. 328]MBF8221892.1 PhoPQ-activated pathogenicity protein [Halomonas sp. 328]
MGRLRQGLLGLLCLVSLLATAAPASSATAPGYHWEVLDQSELGRNQVTLIALTSQQWRGIVWRHQLWLIDPTRGHGASQALLFIAGGSWPSTGAPDTRLPREAPLFAALAQALEAPVAVLRQVPFQPLFDGLSEDALIALTFERFLAEPNEESWPLLGPMVTSAVRAMDALQALTQEWEQPIEAFTLTGASKRGWTTWLAGAADPRVAAIAPMVFDILDMEAQLAHQRRVWGELSPQLGDYTERGLDAQLATPAGQRLQALVDPFQQREALTQPKLVILASNDAYWPVDASNLYWEALPEPRHLLHLPNQGHRARDLERLIPTLASFHRHVAEGSALPRLSWRYACEGEAVILEVTTDTRPQRAQAWVAQAPRRDFREAHWAPHPLTTTAESHALRLPLPEAGYLALFGELRFDDGATLSTQVRVIATDAGGGCEID